ncbi:MAG: hypothetical protein CFK52_04660 [Chloracidobacterium sp. CP2_5A]|nr:MAG: hypothetical protein CFK52_04660 [Chloracidobacterium sp. CP2_5A]
MLSPRCAPSLPPLTLMIAPFDQSLSSTKRKSQALVWTGWSVLLSLTIFALGSGQAYSPPIARLREREARARAEELLKRLRPASLAERSLSDYRVAQQCQRDQADQARWEFAFLAPDDSHLYRLTLSRRGDFRAFALYRRTPLTEAEPPLESATLRALVEAWRDFLAAEAKIAPPLADEAPAVARESPLPGHARDVIRRWKTNDETWPFVEIAFEGQALQSLTLAQEPPPRESPLDGAAQAITVLLLAIALWLPWLVLFIRGALRREMGSLTVLVVSGALAACLAIWLLLLLGFALLAPFAWGNPSISEVEFASLPDVTYRLSVFLLTLATTGVASLAIAGLGLVSLAVTESYDWKRQRQLLGDIYRLSRRKHWPPPHVARLYGGAFALALWILAIETGVAGQSGHPALPWHEFSAWSQSLALGHLPGWKIWGECFCGLWLVTVWLTPMLAFARNRLSDRSAALAVGCLLGLAGFPFVAQSWAAAAGYALLVAALLWTLLRYGWLAVVFAYLLIGGFFPLLWSLRFPGGFEPDFLAGGIVAALPMALAWRYRQPPRQGRNEAFDLAPSYVRNRLRLERWREERDVRWLIHGNLLPPSGFRDERRRLVAEYAHLPEQGREWFVALPLDDERIGVAIGEVSGQELQASLLMATVLAAIKSKAARYADCPARVVERLNDFLSPRLREVDSEVRLVYGVADFRSGEFAFCNAGYVAPIALPAAEASSPISLSQAVNPPLDGLTDLRFAAQTVRLARGSRLILMSDWVGELCELAPDAEALLKKNAQLLAAFGSLPAQELPGAIIREGRERLRQQLADPSAKTMPDVEMTVICIEF